MNLVGLSSKLGVTGFMHPDELDALVELCCNKDVLEIGSFKGLSSMWIASVAKHLTCVDTFKANDAGQIQLEEDTTYNAFKRGTRRFSNIDTFKFESKDAVDSAYLIDLDFDIIFLDAMHTYEDVRDDIKRWWPRVRPGGTMIFHDYGHGDFPGVKKAVDEWITKYNLAMGHEPVGTLAWVTNL